ncbi:MAG: carboxylesterase [Planctomycetota bacterium]|nr:MAG: carboxylesterase [Planctomycetota bacterium]
MSAQMVALGGRQLGLVRGRLGEPPPLVPLLLLHGAGGAARNFGSLLRRLPSTAAALDLPGHGRSGGQPLVRLEQVVELVRELLPALWPEAERVVLGGHSLGGALALAAAARARSEGWRPEVAGFVGLGVAERLALGERYAELAARDFPRLLEVLAHQGVPAATLGQLRQAGPAAVAADLRMAHGHALGPDAERFGRPALLVAGEADPIAPPASVRALAARLQQVRLVVLPGVGHLPMVEAPEAVAREVLSFVRDCSRGAA